MRIVDEYRCVIVSAGKLQPSLGAHELFHCRECAGGFGTGRYRQSRCNAGILHLERADEWQTHFVGASPVHNRNDLTEAIDRSTDELDVGPLLSDGDDFQATLVRCLNHLVRIAIVDADNGCPTWRNQILEQAELGCEVGLDAGVIIEMIS